MLRQRLLTALIAMPLAAALVLFAPQWLVGLVLGVILLGGAWEWAAFASLATRRGRLGYLLLTAVLLGLCGWALAAPPAGLAIVAIGLAWWLAAFTWLFRPDARPPAAVAGLCGLLTLLPAWVAIMLLRAAPDGPAALLFLLVLIWAADTGAYTAGRLAGRRRLAPRISPGKTWEGVGGGLFAAAIIGAGGVLYFGLAPGTFIPICVAVAILSIVGDLTESLFKRLSGVKDSGSLLPGHGGLLDRVDSLSAAAPLFYVLLRALAAYL